MEVMIAVFILGVAVLGFYKMASLSNHTANLSFDRTTAIYLAQEKLNLLRVSLSETSSIIEETVTKNDIAFKINYSVKEKTLPFDTVDKEGMDMVNASVDSPAYYARGMLVSINVTWGSPLKNESLMEFIPNGVS